MKKIHTPLGEMVLFAFQGKITGIEFADTCGDKTYPDDEGSGPLLSEVAKALQEYFDKARTSFDFGYCLNGTPFQNKVWELLSEIPYGTFLTYGDLAKSFKRPMSAQAIGQAVGSNPISILIPCHRVLGANTKLTGYGGGLWRKKALLDLEGIPYR
ncbi:MAG: methylated-DNA--[protein]-cysteine S-methyltransferase [Erysipelotrichaceae bacterium]|jgi:methylated-DNA-[protein]-cysteine S-methyltransferase|nr:methylated-DNA--[protein]-cysteine S-methyltransferase [Erysipelotrichaceae bacterium]